MHVLRKIETNACVSVRRMFLMISSFKLTNLFLNNYFGYKHLGLQGFVPSRSETVTMLLYWLHHIKMELNPNKLYKLCLDPPPQPLPSRAISGQKLMTWNYIPLSRMSVLKLRRLPSCRCERVFPQMWCSHHAAGVWTASSWHLQCALGSQKCTVSLRQRTSSRMRSACQTCMHRQTLACVHMLVTPSEPHFRTII